MLQLKIHNPLKNRVDIYIDGSYEGSIDNFDDSGYGTISFYEEVVRSSKEIVLSNSDDIINITDLLKSKLPPLQDKIRVIKSDGNYDTIGF